MTQLGASGPVVLGSKPIGAADLLAIAAGDPVRLGPAARTRMAVSRSVLLAALDRGEAVYGATRRLGAGHADPVTDQAAFQLQVLRNHRGALGEPLDATTVRLGIAARLAHLALGGSGARPEVAEALVGLLNAGIVPAVPERGSVGAADLALLAAVAAVVVGEGTAIREDGEVVPGATALAEAGLAPLELQAHEALSLINTNAFTIGSAALVADRLALAAEVADRVAALSLEAAALHRASGDLGPFAPIVHAPFEPDGQWRSALVVRELLEGSFLLDPARVHAVQDELCFRCVPQVHGALGDAADAVTDLVEQQLAIRPENPLVDAASGTVTPNGGFAPVGLVLGVEAARLAAAHVGAIAERRIAVLSRLARPLRATGAAGIPGLLAYTAAEDLAALRARAQPVSLGATVLSEVEDYATFGWTAVGAAHTSADDLLEILAIEALHAAALIRAAADQPRLGSGTAALQARLVRLLDGDDAEAQVRGAEDVLASA